MLYLDLICKGKDFQMEELNLYGKEASLRCLEKFCQLVKGFFLRDLEVRDKWKAITEIVLPYPIRD